MLKGIELIWVQLGRKSSQIFGNDCACAAIWMFLILWIRLLVGLLKLNSYIPYGEMFASPLFLSFLSRYLPIFRDISPLLPVRITESVMGRLNNSHLSVIIPAHFVGCLFGAVLFKFIVRIPWLQGLGADPIFLSPDENKFIGGIFEAFVTMIYCVIVVVVPEILKVNRLSSYWLEMLVFPFFLSSLSYHQASFSPAAIYALWYVSSSSRVSGVESCVSSINANSNVTNVFTESASSIFQRFKDLQLNSLTGLDAGRVLGPMIGAIFAGLICAKYFPDDAKSWKKSVPYSK